jgi:hypothetical protein
VRTFTSSSQASVADMERRGTGECRRASDCWVPEERTSSRHPPLGTGPRLFWMGAVPNTALEAQKGPMSTCKFGTKCEVILEPPAMVI